MQIFPQPFLALSFTHYNFNNGLSHNFYFLFPTHLKRSSQPTHHVQSSKYFTYAAKTGVREDVCENLFLRIEYQTALTTGCKL